MLARFLYEQADSAVIDGSGLQPDPELAARNLERAKEVIKKMGSKWCLSPQYDEQAEHELYQQRMRGVSNDAID